MCSCRAFFRCLQWYRQIDSSDRVRLLRNGRMTSGRPVGRVLPFTDRQARGLSGWLGGRRQRIRCIEGWPLRCGRCKLRRSPRGYTVSQEEGQAQTLLRCGPTRSRSRHSRSRHVRGCRRAGGAPCGGCHAGAVCDSAHEVLDAIAQVSLSHVIGHKAGDRTYGRPRRQGPRPLSKTLLQPGGEGLVVR